MPIGALDNLCHIKEKVSTPNDISDKREREEILQQEKFLGVAVRTNTQEAEAWERAEEILSGRDVEKAIILRYFLPLINHWVPWEEKCGFCHYILLGSNFPFCHHLINSVIKASISDFTFLYNSDTHHWEKNNYRNSGVDYIEIFC